MELPVKWSRPQVRCRLHGKLAKFSKSAARKRKVTTRNGRTNSAPVSAPVRPLEQWSSLGKWHSPRNHLIDDVRLIECAQSINHFARASHWPSRGSARRWGRSPSARNMFPLLFSGSGSPAARIIASLSLLPASGRRGAALLARSLARARDKVAVSSTRAPTLERRPARLVGRADQWPAARQKARRHGDRRVFVRNAI